MYATPNTAAPVEPLPESTVKVADATESVQASENSRREKETKDSKETEKKKKEQLGEGAAHELETLHDLTLAQFSTRLRIHSVAGNDPRVEPNHPRVFLVADDAVHRITDRLALELTARLEALDRMTSLARLGREDTDRMQAYGRESRASNLSLLLGDEAVQHDSSIHPSLKGEVRDRVRALLWGSLTSSEQKQSPGIWANN